MFSKMAATLRLCATTDSGSDRTEEERYQVRMLHDPRFRSLIGMTETVL